MRRPSFQFYPDVWRANTKLRRCSFRLRGVWIELMGLMHDSDEYGVLRWPKREMADAAGCRLADLDGLREKSVLKGADVGEQFAGFVYRPRHGRKNGDPVTLIPATVGPIFFSSRMVVDEYVRQNTGKATRFAAPSQIPGEAPSQRQGAPPSQREGDGSASASASASENFKTLSTLSGKAPDAESQRRKEKVNNREAKAALMRADATSILLFLNEKTQRRYEAVPANIDLIVGRLKDGFTPAHCRQVIAKKVREWTGSEKMDEFLRPKTLFNRTNFANYAGELVPESDDEDVSGM